MAVSLLGPLRVDGVDRLAPRDRVVLAALALHPGAVLSAERLADALWGETPPPSWPKVVQGSVMRLRRSLGRDAVVTTSSGYRLALADDEIDIRRFERLTARGRSLLAAGEPDRAGAVLAEALGLWRGTPVADLADWAAGRSAAARLHELRLAAEEALLEARLGAGHDVVPDATALVATEPLREHRWWLLATALYQAGRQSDALGAIRRASRTLQDELGLDPGPELAELERAILNQDPDLAPSAPAAPPASDVCPYKGLLVYDRGDSDRFFGRDGEVTACLRVLRDAPVLVVTGPSGCGKSSLVRAGVVPSLEQAGNRVRVVAPGTDPVAALTVALSGSCSVVVVDQFEELFTAGHPRSLVIGVLDRLVHAARAGIRLVLVLRADSVSGLALSPDLSRLAEEGLHLVASMTAPELRAAVEEPARRAGLRLEAGLVELLIREVEDEPGALPLLSHALAETWVRREGTVLTVEGYRSAGGIRGAVAQTAEQLWQSLNPHGRAAMRAVLLRLAVPSAGGQPTAARLPVVGISGEPRRALELLTASRLVTTDESTATVAHEAVLRAWPRLRSWLDEDTASQHTLRHLTLAADDWARLGRPDSELYRGARLTAATEWQRTAGPDLTDVEQDFLAESQALARAEEDEVHRRARAQARQNRRLRAALGGTAAALLLAMLAGAVAVQQSRDAAAAARAARIDQLVAQSAALRDTQRDLAALLAIEAFRLDRGTATKGALFGVFTGTPGFVGYRRLHGGLPAAAVPLPDGTTLLVSTVRGALRSIGMRDGQVIATLRRGDPEFVDSRVGVSRDGRTAALVAWEGPPAGGGRAVLEVYDLRARARVADPVDLPLDPGAVAVSPDGRHVAVSGYDNGRVLVFDTGTAGGLPELANVDDTAVGVVQPPPPASGPRSYFGRRHTAAVAFTAAGELLAGSERGQLRVIDPVTGRVVRRLTGAPPLSTTNRLVQSADGTVLVSTGTDAVVRWDPENQRPLWVQRLDETSCHAVALGPDDGTVLCGGRSGQVTELDVRTGAVTGRRFDMQRGPLAGLVPAADGTALLELSRTEPVLARWHLDGAGPVGRRLPGAAARLAFDAGGRLLLASGPPTYVNDRGVRRPVTRLLEWPTGQLLRTLTPDEVFPIWTGHPGQLAAWTEPGPGYVRDARTGRVVRRLDGGFGDPAWGGAVFGDGRWLLGWGSEFLHSRRPVWKVWDLRDGQGVAAGTTDGGRSGSLTPDGRTLVWSGDGEVSAYAVEGGRLLARRTGVHHAAVSPRGVLVASLEDGRLVTLDRDTLRVRDALLPAAPGRMEELRFTGDGRLLAARGGDGRVRIVDVRGRRQLGEPVRLTTGSLLTVAMHPAGRAVLLGGSDQVVSWDLRPGAWRRAACRLAGRSLTREEWAVYLEGLGPYRRTCPAS